MVKSMKLTDEEKIKFDKFMEFKKTSVCLACNFSFIDTTGGLRKIALVTYSGNEMDRQQQPVRLHTNKILPMISVTCNNCGFVQLFDSRIAFSLK